MPGMDENKVVGAVCTHLQNKGYEILERRHTTEKGVDIVAIHPVQPGKLFIEAKGGTSSRNTSARFGLEYNESQVHYCVAKGVFTGLHMRSVHAAAEDKVALAYPDSIKFRKYLKQVEPALKDLGITVFLVQPDMSVVDLHAGRTFS